MFRGGIGITLIVPGFRDVSFAFASMSVSNCQQTRGAPHHWSLSPGKRFRHKAWRLNMFSTSWRAGKHCLRLKRFISVRTQTITFLRMRQRSSVKIVFLILRVILFLHLLLPLGQILCGSNGSFLAVHQVQILFPCSLCVPSNRFARFPGINCVSNNKKP